MQLFHADKHYDAFRRVLEETLLVCAHAHLRLLLATQPSAFRSLARTRRRPFPIYAANDQHAYAAVATGQVSQKATGICTRGASSRFLPESDEHFYAVVWYVERNASRAGLVAQAEDWPWGSLHQRARKVGGPLLGDWPLPEPSDWTERVNAPQTEAELQAIRRSVRRGSPYGSAFWTEQTAKQLRLESTLRGRSRPRRDSL